MALGGLTAEFEMGSGSGPPLEPPGRRNTELIEVLDQANWPMDMSNESDEANRAISTSQLKTLLPLHIWPINVVVFHGSILRDLVLTWVSRLDAFSGYPVRT